MSPRISRGEARSLLHEWIDSDSLRRHWESVAFVIGALEARAGEFGITRPGPLRLGAPAATGLRPLREMAHRAERVTDAVLAPVTDQQHGRVIERLGTPRAPAEPPARLAEQATRLPVRPLQSPRNHVLEPAERSDSLADGLSGTKSIVGVDVRTAPTTCRSPHDRQATPGCGGRW
jgi:hypothetical protein